MRKLLFILAFVCAIPTVHYSQDSLSISQQELEERYYGDWNFAKAKQLIKQGKLKAARPYYEAAIQSFDQKGQWEAYIETHSALIWTYRIEDGLEECQQIGARCIDRIREKAFRKWIQ